MRFQGRLTRWDDSRGFGFIVPNGGGRAVFAHIREFARGARPADGMLLTYELNTDGERGPQARRIARVAAARRRRLPAAGALLAPAAALLFFAALGGAVLAGWLSAALLAVYAALSLATWWAYHHDKQAAIRHNRRTREDHLHLLALAGGWPGALLAQRWLRHKSAKPGFQIVFWITVLANGGALLWITRSGLLA